MRSNAMLIHSSRLRYLSTHDKAQERIATIELEPNAHTILHCIMLMTMLMMTATMPMMMMAYLNAIAFYFRLHDLFENIDPNTTVTEL